jgi:hypothetical protein
MDGKLYTARNSEWRHMPRLVLEAVGELIGLTLTFLRLLKLRKGIMPSWYQYEVDQLK